MRELLSTQLKAGKAPLIGVTPIEDIKFDPKCRDEITKILRGLQEMYICEELRLEIFDILKQMLPENISPDKGRKGMDLWTIFVLGVLRLGCNWDYDKLKSCFDNHIKIREMTGVDLFCDLGKVTSLKCIQDNVSLFTEKISNQIYKLVARFGHQYFLPKKEELHTRCDSFVFLSNVHFPTDFNLLLDSIRVVIRLCSSKSENLNLPGWREHDSMWEKARACYNKLSKMRYSNSKKEDIKEKRLQEINGQINSYLELAERYFKKAMQLQDSLDDAISLLETYLDYGNLFIDQIKRRVFDDIKTPPEDKVYSIFEPYTEWICKGKAGVRQELGVKVCIVDDQLGFILNHRVMNKQQDTDVAVVMAKESKDYFPLVASMSFDKGFHSKRDSAGDTNRTKIEKESGIEAFIPVKGRPNKEDQHRQSSPEFIAARKQHPAVESAINALASHGLDRCPDRGEVNYKRYVSMAMTASNIHRLGALFMARDLKRSQRKAA